MRLRQWSVLCVLAISLSGIAQLPLARDTISVVESGRTLRMPWAGGINSSQVSEVDIDRDGKKDLVLFEKQNGFAYGIFRCFLRTGDPARPWRAEPGLSYFFPPVTFWAIFRDYDADGVEDIFCYTTSGIKLYQNQTQPGGLPTFSLVSAELQSNYFPNDTIDHTSNLYAGATGFPGIADVDGDGDQDVLTFTPYGVYLELHRNMSHELYGHSKALVFRREDQCWGGLSESQCKIEFDVCQSTQASNARPQHAGSCITCLDNDGDLDMDLLMGDMNCDFVQYAQNTGGALNADFTDSTRFFPNFPAKNTNGTQIEMSFFPCAHLADVDGDGKKDLIATPNIVSMENTKSIWYYRNTTTSSAANFQLQKKNFLQEDMIEVGQGSAPFYLDVDNDGLKDLLIGSEGYFENDKLVGKITHYRNVGTATVPAFSLVTRDLGQLSQYDLNYLMAAPGDVDADGDMDIICVATSTQVQLSWLENTAGTGHPCTFTQWHQNAFSLNAPATPLSPFMFDIDGDGRQDLLIGMKNGRIAYYRNSGGSPYFELKNGFFGDVDVKKDISKYGLEGDAMPFLYREGQNTYLLVGSVNGDIAYYFISDFNQPFYLAAGAVNGYDEGSQSAPWYEDINGDGKRDLIIGNAGGGLAFFSSASPYVGLDDNSRLDDLGLYPNPAQDAFLLVLPEGVRLEEAALYDCLGNLVLHPAKNKFEVGVLQPGVYILNATLLSGGITKTVQKKVLVSR